MLKVKSIIIKNFLSAGNAPQTINFDREELILVLGENLDLGGEDSGSRNGVGKTLLMNSLSYALYGWPISDIKKEHLVNLSNGKNMQVTLEFESHGKPYKIIRGHKPRILEFYDGTKILKDKDESEDAAQGDSRETQKEIEKVLGMSHNMFCQIVAANTYTTPFLFQKNNEQRIIIEQLLGITLLSEKAEKLKEEVKIVKDQITKEDARIKAVESANKRIQEQINSLILKQENWTRKKNSDIEALQKKVEHLSKIDIDEELLIHEKWSEYEIAERERTALQQQQSQLTASLSKEQNLLSKHEKDLLSLDKKCCQTCNQKLETSIHITLLENTKKQIAQCNEEISTILEGISLVSQEISSVPVLEKPIDKSYATLNEAHDHRNKLMLLMQELQQKQNEIDPYKDQIFSMQNTALEVVDTAQINALSTVMEHQEFLYKLLTNKDSFIRKKIIEQNLNYLNTRLGYYLTTLGLPHEVIFQNDLSVNITELGRELSFGNLSRGEAGRLSLGLSFAFRDTWENLFQKINLLFIDELIDNGMDGSGTDAAIKLLRDMSRDQDKAIWLVSHKDEIISKCDTVLKVVKENGFTTFHFLE